MFHMYEMYKVVYNSKRQINQGKHALIHLDVHTQRLYEQTLMAEH